MYPSHQGRAARLRCLPGAAYEQQRARRSLDPRRGQARPYRHAWHHQDPWLGWGDGHVAARRRSGRITLLYRCTQPTCRGAKREGSPAKSSSSERDSSLCTARSERMLLLLHIAVESNVACSTSWIGVGGCSNGVGRGPHSLTAGPWRGLPQSPSQRA